jgi:hypothetical protein
MEFILSCVGMLAVVMLVSLVAGAIYVYVQEKNDNNDNEE